MIIKDFAISLVLTTLFTRLFLTWRCMWAGHETISLEPRLSFPDFVSQLWRKIRRKAWKDFPCDAVAPRCQIYQMPRKYVMWNVHVVVYFQGSEGKKMQDQLKRHSYLACGLIVDQA